MTVVTVVTVYSLFLLCGLVASAIRGSAARANWLSAPSTVKDRKTREFGLVMSQSNGETSTSSGMYFQCTIAADFYFSELRLHCLKQEMSS